MYERTDIRGRGIRILDKCEFGLDGSIFFTGSGVVTSIEISSGASSGRERSPREACQEVAGRDIIQVQETSRQNEDGRTMADLGKNRRERTDPGLFPQER